MKRYQLHFRVEEPYYTARMRALIDQTIQDFFDFIEVGPVEERSDVENGNGIITRKQKFTAIDTEDTEVEGQIYEREVLRNGQTVFLTIEVEAWEK